MKLKHPASKHAVETDNPEPYLSQGWAEVKGSDFVSIIPTATGFGAALDVDLDDPEGN